MNILILGDTRFFGIDTVHELLRKGHDVTIATRGLTPDSFGKRVKRVIYDRTDTESIKRSFCKTYYDVIIDKIAYSSNDVKRILDIVLCDKYIQMSSTAVYDTLHPNIKESEFNPMKKKLVWCERADFDYGEAKRQAECAIAQCYGEKESICVRYPVVLGKNDYTKRLDFYVRHIAKSQPMLIDNIDAQLSFINSEDAGKFIAYLSETNYQGAVNGASNGTISVRQIINYVEKKLKKQAVIIENGENAPYNSTCEFSVSTEKAKETGFIFTDINDWIYDLLDYYISQY